MAERSLCKDMCKAMIYNGLHLLQKPKIIMQISLKRLKAQYFKIYISECSLFN